jgi:transcriptional regulator with XRE-family HTH domain
MARTRNLADLIKAKTTADPVLAEAVEQEAVNAYIAQQVYDLRTAAKLTQKELADRLGTTQSVISRIEDADYEGHSLGLLKRIADALGKKLTITFSDPEPVPTQTTEAASPSVQYHRTGINRITNVYSNTNQNLSVVGRILERN